MFDLQEVIEKRLALLKGELNHSISSKNNCVDPLDITKEGITKSLIQAGILDETGKLKELNIK